MDSFYYCKGCNATITIEKLVLLKEGQCPVCISTEGFSSVSNEESDPFAAVTMINELELKE